MILQLIQKITINTTKLMQILNPNQSSKVTHCKTANERHLRGINKKKTTHIPGDLKFTARQSGS